jgi:hypothetical protein
MPFTGAPPSAAGVPGIRGGPSGLASVRPHQSTFPAPPTGPVAPTTPTVPTAPGAPAAPAPVSPGGAPETVAAARTNAGAAYLSGQRQAITNEINADPALRNLYNGMLRSESGETTNGMTATGEAFYNRLSYIRQNINPNWSVRDELTRSGFYGTWRSGQMQSHSGPSNPGEMTDNAFNNTAGGSNLIQGRTDQGSANDPNVTGPGRIRVPGTNEVYNFHQGRRRLPNGQWFYYSHAHTQEYAEQLQRQIEAAQNKALDFTPDSIASAVRGEVPAIASPTNAPPSQTRPAQNRPSGGRSQPQWPNPSNAVPGVVPPGTPTGRPYTNPGVSVPGTSPATQATGATRMTTVGNYRLGGDQRRATLLQAAAEASKSLPPGYRVEAYSGQRDKKTDGPHRFNAAIDFRIIGPDGKEIPNYQSPENYAIYERFAQNTHLALEKINPALAKEHRWGGYFSGPFGKYGAMDEMHQDFAGGASRMAAGNFETGINPTWKKIWGVQETAGTINTAREAAKRPTVDPSKPLEGKPIQGLTPGQQQQIPKQIGPDKVTSNEELIKEAEATNMSPAEFLRRQATIRQPGEYGEAGEPGYQVGGPVEEKKKTSRAGNPLSKDTEAAKNQKMVDRYKDPTQGKTIRSPTSTIFYTGPEVDGKPQESVTYTDPETGETYTDRTKPTTSPASGAADVEPGIATQYTLPGKGKETLGGYYLITPEKGPHAGESFIFRHTDIGPSAKPRGHTDFNAPAVKQIYGRPDAKAIKGNPYIRYIGPELPENVGTGRINDEDIPSVVKLNKDHEDFIKEKRAEREYPLEGSQIGKRLDPNANPLDNLDVINGSNARATWDKPYGSNVRDLSDTPDPSERARQQTKESGTPQYDQRSIKPKDPDKPKEGQDPGKPRQDIKDPEKADSSSDTSNATGGGDKSDATGGGQIESPA